MSNATPALSRYEVLLDVARQLSSSQKLEELLDHILQRSRDVMDCEVCSILLPDGPEENLIIRSTHAFTTNHVIRVPKGKGIAGDAYITGRTINLADARNDPRHFKPASDQTGLVARAMLTVPLLDGDRCVGVMQAINPNHQEVFGKGDQDLFETFGSLIAVTLLRIDSQRRAIQEAEMRQQMNSAKEIQASFLPSDTLSAGDISVKAFYQSASEVGGDFYFWHEIGQGKILLGMGDVCGKGLPAALDMARGSTLIASMAFQCRRLGLAHWLTALNSRLCGVMRAGRFIAMSAMLVDSPRRRISLCSAGLPAPKVLGADGWRDVSLPGNPPLGIACDLVYHDQELPLALGRQWMILSDGILELQNRRGEFFEDAAFAATLERAFREDLPALDELATDWRRFAHNAAYQDDATAMVVSDHSASPPPSIELPCQPESLKQARDFIDAWAAYAGFSKDAAGLIVLACDEVMTNITKHAYCDDQTGGPATCRAAIDDEGLRITISHQGKGITNEDFDRLAKPPSAGERIGGLGFHVIREVFDRIDFQVEAGSSKVELIKKLGA